MFKSIIQLSWTLIDQCQKNKSYKNLETATTSTQTNKPRTSKPIIWSSWTVSTEISTLKPSILKFKSNKQNTEENLPLTKRTRSLKCKSIETMEPLLRTTLLPCNREINLLRMPWLNKLFGTEHKLKKTADLCPLIGTIGMIPNILKNKDRLLLISRRNKKNWKERLRRKRRRSPRRRRRLDPLVVMSWIWMLMMVLLRSTNLLVSELSKNPKWTKN